MYSRTFLFVVGVCILLGHLPGAHALPPGTNSTGCTSNLPGGRFIEDIVGIHPGVLSLDDFGFLGSGALGAFTIHPAQDYAPDSFFYNMEFDMAVGDHPPNPTQPTFPIPVGNPVIYATLGEAGYGATSNGVDGDINFLFFDLTTSTLSLDGFTSSVGRSYTRVYVKGLRMFAYNTAAMEFESYTRIAGVWTFDVTFGSIGSASDTLAFSQDRDEMVMVNTAGTTLDFYHVTGGDTVDVFFMYSITPSAYSAGDVTDIVYDHNDDLVVGVSTDSDIYIHLRSAGVFSVPYSQVLMNTGNLDTQGFRLASNAFGEPRGVISATAPGSQPSGAGSSGGVVYYSTPIGGGSYSFEFHYGTQYSGSSAMSNWRGRGGFPNMIYINDGTFDNGTPPGSFPDAAEGRVVAYCAEDFTCEGTCGTQCDGPNVPCEIYEWVPGVGCPAVGVPAPGVSDGNVCTTDTCIPGVGVQHIPISGGACSTKVFDVDCPGVCVNGGCERDDFLCGVDGPSVTPSPTPSSSASNSNTPSPTISPSNTPSISVTSSNTPSISDSASNSPPISSTASNSPTASNTPAPSATSSNSPAPSATSSNTPAPSVTSSVTPSNSNSATASATPSATTSVGGICAAIASCDDGDECTIDDCVNARGGCVHDYVTPGTSCVLSGSAPIDLCFPAATGGYCPGPGWPCSQDTRGHIPLQCPASYYTCQEPSECDPVLGCSLINNDALCPSVPPDMAPCARYSCEPTNTVASATTHGCYLIPIANPGDPCEHPDLCRINTRCDASMTCTGGEPVRCPLATTLGFANVCEGGVCVEREVNIDQSAYIEGDDDDDDDWKPWVYTTFSLTLLLLLLLCCCCCVFLPLYWYFTQEVDDDALEDGSATDSSALVGNDQIL